MARDDEGLLDEIRRICTAFPGVTERPSHGTPTWFVNGKASFVQLWPHGHHRDEFPHLWCAAEPGAQEELVAANPRVFFRPPYVGHRGWIGVRLDQGASWAEVAELCEDAYRAVAPKRLLAELDADLAES
ncbi:MmcQ/YjbR family DNA-binding protein [Micromonospora sp. SL4-19]|uniref:MmcQ/YjbR family DNA-binding protein n=1 Tax=Micromonospora sp. SL4-19 TaxID=3399129 RepID=UPI003A4D95ED